MAADATCVLHSDGEFSDDRVVRLIDPTCRLTEGHNWETLEVLWGISLRTWPEARVFAHLPDSPDFAQAVEPTWVERDVPDVYRPTVKGVDENAASVAESVSRMVEFFRELLSRPNRGSPELWVFPCMDYVSLRSLLVLLREHHRLPIRLAVRFIGVMELWAGARLATLQDEVDPLVRALSIRQPGISFATETTPLSSWLSSLTNLPSDWIPVAFGHRRGKVRADDPDHSRDFELAMAQLPEQYAVLPGAIRPDKGAWKVSGIARALKEGGSPAAIVVQAPRGSMAQELRRDMAQWDAIGNVRLLPPLLSASELSEVMVRSGAVVLPYERETYHLRGSASVGDAVALRRPILSLSGLAFSSLIEYYGVGRLFPDEQTLGAGLGAFLGGDDTISLAALEAGASKMERDAAQAARDWLVHAR